MIRVVGSELTKLLTLRSIVVTLGVLAVLTIGLAALSAPAVGHAITTDDPMLAPGVVPEAVGMEWVLLGQIGMVVLGVVAASSEQVNGQVLTSLVAVPRRGLLVGAKLVALLLVASVTAALTIPATSLVSQAGLGEVGVTADGIPESLVDRWVGAVATWVALALLAFGLTLLLRRAVLPLVALVVLSQLSVVLVMVTPWAKVLPTVAGVQLFDPTQISVEFPRAALSGQVAGVVVAAWTVALVATACAVFIRRDVKA